jgi:hypothetical protein
MLRLALLGAKEQGVFMTKDESKNNEVNDPRWLGEDADRSSMPGRDPIEPDPMNPVSPADTEPNSVKRPDLDWSEHED